jgi:hypothetical protein
MGGWAWLELAMVVLVRAPSVMVQGFVLAAPSVLEWGRVELVSGGRCSFQDLGYLDVRIGDSGAVAQRRNWVGYFVLDEGQHIGSLWRKYSSAVAFGKGTL